MKTQNNQRKLHKDQDSSSIQNLEKSKKGQDVSQTGNIKGEDRSNKSSVKYYGN
ncbi:hypothetical protein BH10PSE19_BH10PSE19_13970 [soil metagenome]